MQFNGFEYKLIKNKSNICLKDNRFLPGVRIFQQTYQLNNNTIMDANTIRAKFLEFFEKNGHQIVPSAPLVVKDDPTLMFTNAGMNQFKDFFLGNKESKNPRLADTQKCLRVSGKHNDLEEVGLDTYHHTMFEMLGNWSFGDYFKQDAIRWGWELLTKVYGLPEQRLYVTVFGGDKQDGLEPDNEAYQLWNEIVPEDRILYGSKKDNFWEMGDTGPCGPCSEIHFDMRDQAQVDSLPGSKLVNQDDPEVIEIWNLVFIQFNRQASGKLMNLPARHVDTGMGFERLVRAVQGKKSNYDTDLFKPLIDYICRKAGINYGDNEEPDIAVRVIVDHIRAISFAIADGQLPSNNKAGYVIRRILRRAVRYGFTFLNFKSPFLYQLVKVLAEQFKKVFPELDQQKDFITKVIQEEESSFLRTLEVGLRKLDQIQVELPESVTTISGKQVFELYDTFGFPVDLTALIAREKGLSIDEAGFQREMEQQKSRSKQAAAQQKGDWIIVHDEDESEFLGYEQLETTARILRYRQVEEKKRTYLQLVLDKTPFYAESGGQIGDTGFLSDGNDKIAVFNTKKENELIIHFTNKLPENLENTFTAKVDAGKRQATQYNHSATHLLHAALRQVLGKHVQQKGSLVSEKILRFDFAHFAKMTDEEIEAVEKIVNEKIRTNIPLIEQRNIPLEKAKELGAMALFGEKYGEFVRVITFDPEYSVELCGGTHVKATGNIGILKIISESSVAAGVRRIEALTGEVAKQYIDRQLQMIDEIKELLKGPKEPLKAIENLLQEKSHLEKEIESLHLKQLTEIKNQLKSHFKEVNGCNLIIQQVELPNADALKKIAFELKNELDNLILVLAASINGKPQIAVMISENILKDKQLNASELVKEFAREIKGGGGGQPFFATAGGKDISGLPAVVDSAVRKLNDQLRS